MKALTFALVIGFGSVFTAHAQETIPAVEVGVNYSWFHANSPNDNYNRNGNGGSGYLEYNLNRVVGLVGDFGAYANTRVSTNNTIFSYLFGPRFNWRHSRFNPYAQFLFGGAYAWSSPFGLSTTQNGFATAAGSGLDVRFSKHIAFKPLQVEYVMTQLPTALTNRNSHQNNLRYSAGVVFQFGQK
jgi:hypothetical protein